MLKLSLNLLFFHSYYAFMKVECENYLQIILLWCGHVISKLSNMNNIILIQKHRVDYFGCNAFSKTWRPKIYEKVFFVIWHSFKDINRNYMKIWSYKWLNWISPFEVSSKICINDILSKLVEVNFYNIVYIYLMNNFGVTTTHSRSTTNDALNVFIYILEYNVMLSVCVLKCY